MVTKEEIQQWGDLRRAARNMLRCVHVTAVKLMVMQNRSKDTWGSSARLAAEHLTASGPRKLHTFAGIQVFTKLLGTCGALLLLLGLLRVD